MPLSFGSLFAGIGGLDLGLERAGMVCKWQVEIDPYCRRVLEIHWPDVRRWDDVRTWPQPDAERVDLLCGGFPCQDVSRAGKQVGIDGPRSGLWSELARIIRDCRPRFVLLENTPGLLDGGIDRVLWDLAKIGFNAEWTVLSSCRFGAPHTRERVFVLAYPNGDTRERFKRGRVFGPQDSDQERNVYEQWSRDEPPRVADGVSGWMDTAANRAIGNAVDPRVSEFIGRRIVEAVESAA